MAKRTTRKEDIYAPEIPSRNLPPVTYRDLPDPPHLGTVLGPGAVLIGASISTGELILWPYVASQAGLTLLWAAVIGVLTQFFINMEIGRYTLATGETAISGFTRLWKPWGIIFVVITIVTLAWPAWSTGAATMLTFAFGGGNVVLLSIVFLVGVGIALTISPVIYKTVEKVFFVKIIIMLVFFALAAVLAIEGRAWGNLATPEVSSLGQLPEAITFTVLMSAIAYAGGGGVGNLTLSNWLRDKGMGMGAHIPRLVSPITGEEEAVPGTGYMVPRDEENIRRWKGWWRVANQEHFATFVLIGAVSIVLMSLLAYSTVFGREVGQGLDFLRVEGETLQSIVAPWFGTLFWLIGAMTLLGAALGILEYVGRITADVLKVEFLRESRFWSESKIYCTVVWAEIIFGSVILLSGVNQPLVLVIISAVMSGIAMFVYSILLIKLNRSVLPDPMRLRGVRLTAMVWAVLFFGFFASLVVIDQARQLFGV